MPVRIVKSDYGSSSPSDRIIITIPPISGRGQSDYQKLEQACLTQFPGERVTVVHWSSDEQSAAMTIPEKAKQCIDEIEAALEAAGESLSGKKISIVGFSFGGFGVGEAFKYLDEHGIKIENACIIDSDLRLLPQAENTDDFIKGNQGEIFKANFKKAMEWFVDHVKDTLKANKLEQSGLESALRLGAINDLIKNQDKIADKDFVSQFTAAAEEMKRLLKLQVTQRKQFCLAFVLGLAKATPEEVGKCKKQIELLDQFNDILLNILDNVRQMLFYKYEQVPELKCPTLLITAQETVQSFEHDQQDLGWHKAINKDYLVTRTFEKSHTELLQDDAVVNAIVSSIKGFNLNKERILLQGIREVLSELAMVSEGGATLNMLIQVLARLQETDLLGAAGVDIRTTAEGTQIVLLNNKTDHQGYAADDLGFWRTPDRCGGDNFILLSDARSEPPTPPSGIAIGPGNRG